jgi:hypothetical protein
VKNEGTNRTARQVEAIMPLNTQRPSEMRELAARAGRRDERHDAQDEGERRHQDGTEAGAGRLDGRLDDVLAVEQTALARHFDDQDGVLGASAISSIRPIWV